ncbi:hypothetical protein EDD85DRAFT_436339 [Armillaria nabsnona]|nr:hypothetical protein EDD85DRAFT_436339 [Armillaria nabsnona]
MVALHKDPPPPKSNERREAHNASSCRSYAKNRHLINERRRDTYRRQKKLQASMKRPFEPLIRKAARLVDIEFNSGYSHEQRLCRRSSELAEAMAEIDRLSARFAILTTRSPSRHASVIYHEHMLTVTEDCPKGYRSFLDNAVLTFSSLEQSLQEYENIILNCVGVGKEMRRYHLVWEPIQRMVGWLEEMLCEAMISPKGLKEKYERRELAFRMLN